MTHEAIGGRDVAVLYGAAGTPGATVLRYASQPRVTVLDGPVTSAYAGGDLRLDYTHSGLARVLVTGGGHAAAAAPARHRRDRGAVLAGRHRRRAGPGARHRAAAVGRGRRGTAGAAGRHRAGRSDRGLRRRPRGHRQRVAGADPAHPERLAGRVACPARTRSTCRR